MVRIQTLLAVLVAVLAGCHGSTSTEQHPVGAESFLSQPPGGVGGAGKDATGGTGTAGVGAGTPAPATAGASNDAAAAPRDVVEADIYARDGSRLYVLNSYRGLQVIDLADPAAPRLVSKVRIAGHPVDLYLRGATALVAVSDVFAYEGAADGSVRPRRGSRVLAVDVSDPAHPVVASDLAIDGEVEQTRIVGDVLYVVSRKYSWYDFGPVATTGGVGIGTAGSGTASAAPVAAGAGGVAVGAMPIGGGGDTIYVASFDLRNAAHPVAAARVDFEATGWETHANVTNDRVTLSFAGYGPDASGAYGPLTRFRVVDISDPGGALVLGAAFETRGRVRDRWGMDWSGATGQFRAVVDVAFNAGAALEIWASPDRDHVTSLSRVAVNVPESLTAARFDGSRVYVVTARSTDPLWTIDASDPRNPVLVGQLHMPGQLDFIEPRGDRLVALGHTNEAGKPWQLAVTLIDVTQLAAPRQLDRKTFGESFSWVSANPDDLRKAFIVLDPPPAGIGLVLVPLQGWDRNTYRQAGGTQLLDLGRDTLTLEGFLSHPGAVQRAFPVDPSGATLAALSDSALQVIDARNRAAPAEKARLDLARSVATLAVTGGKAIELSGDWSSGVMELAVTEALDPDAAVPLARVDLGAPQARMMQDGDVLWVLAHDASTGKSWMQAVDVRDPAHPLQRGRLDLSAGESFGYPRSWGFGDEAVRVGHAIAIHHASWICSGVCAGTATAAGTAAPGGANAGTATDPIAAPGAGIGAPDPSSIRIYDVSDPDHPRLASTVAAPGAAWAWGLTATGRFLWITHFEWETSMQMGRYYLDRIDLSDPSSPKLLPSINVPGVFLAASPDGARIYTVETTWTSSSVTTSLHRLALSPTTARLESTIEIDGYPEGAAQDGGFAWIVAGPRAYGEPARLVTADLVAMQVTQNQSIEGSWAWLRAAAGGKLFLDGGWNDQGLLLYDLSDPAHPSFEQFFRTPGWVWDVVVADGRAYLPSGPYGVPVIELH